MTQELVIASHSADEMGLRLTNASISMINEAHIGGRSLRFPWTEWDYVRYMQQRGAIGVLADIELMLAHSDDRMRLPKFPYTRLIFNLQGLPDVNVEHHVYWPKEDEEIGARHLSYRLWQADEKTSNVVWQNTGRMCSVEQKPHLQVLRIRA